MTVYSSGKFAYVAANGSNDVYAYTISVANGALTPMAGSPFADPGIGAEDVIISPTDGFAYVPNIRLTMLPRTPLRRAAGR